ATHFATGGPRQSAWAHKDNPLRRQSEFRDRRSDPNFNSVGAGDLLQNDQLLTLTRVHADRRHTAGPAVAVALYHDTLDVFGVNLPPIHDQHRLRSTRDEELAVAQVPEVARAYLAIEGRAAP